MFRLRRYGLLFCTLMIGLISLPACGIISFGDDVFSLQTDTEEMKGRESMIALLDQAATMRFDDYDPSYVIQAVNALQPLGKEAALEEVALFVSNESPESDNYGLFWILRVLFEVPAEQGFPPVLLGLPSVAPPADPTRLPRFPIVLIEDVPLLVISGYDLGGFPQPVQEHIDYFQTYGTIRPAPLSPSQDANAIRDAFTQAWAAAYGEQYPSEVMTLIDKQLLRLEH